MAANAPQDSALSQVNISFPVLSAVLDAIVIYPKLDDNNFYTQKLTELFSK